MNAYMELIDINRRDFDLGGPDEDMIDEIITQKGVSMRKKPVTWGMPVEVIAMVRAIASAQNKSQQQTAADLIVAGIKSHNKKGDSDADSDESAGE